MIIQQSEDWFKIRTGRITASRFADAIAFNQKTKKPTAARDTEMRKIVAEILSGRPRHSVGSKSLGWGIEAETLARSAYELETGNVVTDAEFVVYQDYPFIGGSPDGFVCDKGNIEIKSPHDEQVHINTILNGMPNEHKPQVQGCMMVTGREWCDFISYDPRQSDKYRLYVETVHRDDEYIDTILRPGLLQFWSEVQEMLSKIREKMA